MHVPVSPVRHAVPMTEPVSLPRLPRLPLLTFKDLALAASAGEIHSDRCGWMGGDSAHPCSCKASRTIRMLAAIYGDLLADGE